TGWNSGRPVGRGPGDVPLLQAIRLLRSRGQTCSRSRGPLQASPARAAARPPQSLPALPPRSTPCQSRAISSSDRCSGQSDPSLVFAQSDRKAYSHLLLPARPLSFDNREPLPWRVCDRLENRSPSDVSNSQDVEVGQSPERHKSL